MVPTGDIAVAVLGISGRMGRTVASLIAAHDLMRLSGGWCESPEEATSLPLQGEVAVSADIATALAGADVAIDFTLPTATRTVAQGCAGAGCALVCGTTGLAAAEEEALETASRQIAVLHATNMSTGVHLLSHLSALAAAALDESEWDAHIADIHHRHKRDAPSGTALSLGEAVAGARGHSLAAVRLPLDPGRDSRRPAGGIGFSAVRGGEVVGEHTVAFLGQYETVELRHNATDRRVFAAGALRAARWLAGRPAGRYTMNDVLGLASRREHARR